MQGVTTADVSLCCHMIVGLNNEGCFQQTVANIVIDQ